MCYNVLQTKWLVWSKGYVVPIERTTLRGAKVYAAIAGKDLTEPEKQHDAIWHFFFRVRGKSAEKKFRAEQLQLAVVIDHEEYERVQLRKEELDEITGANAPTNKDTRQVVDSEEGVDSDSDKQMERVACAVGSKRARSMTVSYRSVKP